MNLHACHTRGGFLVLCSVLGLITGGWAPVPAYEAMPPRYINVDFTWKDAKTGEVRTLPGQLWFKDLPVMNEKGQVGGFGKPGYYTGIKWFVPRSTGEVWIARAPGVTDPHTFLLHDHLGERNIVMAFDFIDVTRTTDAQLDKLMDRQISGAAGGIKATGGALPDAAGSELLDDDTGAPPGGAGQKSGKATAPAEVDAGPSPLSLATGVDIGSKRIRVADVIRIVFLDASDGIRRETYGGRFVEYSNQAKGDEGRVQVAAGTFFGGPDGEERFTYGTFLGNGTIVLAGNFADLAFVDPKLIRVVGTDPAPDAYPSVEKNDAKKGRKWTEYPRRTPALVQYSADLRRLNGILRLPWGVGTVREVTRGPDDALYLTGQVGPHFDTFAGEVKSSATVEYPEALAEAQAKKREPGPDNFVLKLSPDQRSVVWLVRVKSAGVNIFLRPDGKLLLRRGNNLFFIAPDGSVSSGPVLDIAGSNMAVDPRNGDMYFGGSYRSATGLEPYVNPYLYKVDASGKQVWTAYGWTGPIVGVAQLRLVADSSITRIRVNQDGSLTFTAWSDGGNSVLEWQPYDMRKEARCSGFCSSVWGATGGLTVRIAHIVHMDARTMEVDHFARYIGYLPTSDIPTLINIYDMCPLPNGEVAITGGGWTGFVETHDAWLRSWYADYQTNEFAQAKGGPFFTLFKSDFSLPRMSTITPGASGLQLAVNDKWVLLYGGATDLKAGDEDRPWARRFRTITREAIQAQNGGGLDAYAVLVDTQGPPRPPEIPPRSWGKPARKGK